VLRAGGDGVASYHRDVALALIEPTEDLHEAWLDAHRDWGPGVHEDGFGLDAIDEVETAEGFAAWVARLRAESDRGTCRWIVEDGRVQGGIALRHHLDERTGHIGYGIRPSARGRGLATWALGQMLRQAPVLAIDRVLVVCASENVGSAKTIEKNGGVLDEVRSTEHGSVRRYWIDLGQRGRPGSAFAQCKGTKPDS
jgi:predicted acetyltransferase